MSEKKVPAGVETRTIPLKKIDELHHAVEAAVQKLVVISECCSAVDTPLSDGMKVIADELREELYAAQEFLEAAQENREVAVS
jgi:hypothetical protein